VVLVVVVLVVVVPVPLAPPLLGGGWVEARGARPLAADWR
jgi:hypothetical protein